MELNKKIIRFYSRFLIAIWLIYTFFKDLKFREMKKIDMKGTYWVNLYPESLQFERFKNLNKNLLRVGLQVGDKSTIHTAGFRVEFVFTINGMLGLGTELIRYALNGAQNGLDKKLIFKPLNLIPTQKVSNLYRGVYLTPDSVELIINIEENVNFNKLNNFQFKKEFSNILFKKKIANNKVIENYLIDLYPNSNEKEEFEIDNKNLLEVRVRVTADKLIAIKVFQPIVYLNFTMDELLEFGEELIRKANDLKRNSLRTSIPVNDSECIIELNFCDTELPLADNDLLIRIKNLNSVIDPNKLESKKFNWQMNNQLNYVSDISDDEITIVAQSSIKKKIIKLLGGHKSFLSKNSWYLICDSDQVLASKLQHLRDLGFMFSYGKSWNPAEVFCDLRDKGYVKGSILRISWQDKNIIIIDKI